MSGQKKTECIYKQHFLIVHVIVIIDKIFLKSCAFFSNFPYKYNRHTCIALFIYRYVLQDGVPPSSQCHTFATSYCLPKTLTINQVKVTSMLQTTQGVCKCTPFTCCCFAVIFVQILVATFVHCTTGFLTPICLISRKLKEIVVIGFLFFYSYFYT